MKNYRSHDLYLLNSRFFSNFLNKWIDLIAE